MGVSLAITNASIAEYEKRVNVAATPKGFFEVVLQPALNKMDGTKKGQKSEGGGMPFDRLRAGDRELDGIPHKYLRPSEWSRAGERRLVGLSREEPEMHPASNLALERPCQPAGRGAGRPKKSASRAPCCLNKLDSPAQLGARRKPAPKLRAKKSDLAVISINKPL